MKEVGGSVDYHEGLPVGVDGLRELGKEGKGEMGGLDYRQGLAHRDPGIAVELLSDLGKGLVELLLLVLVGHFSDPEGKPEQASEEVLLAGLADLDGEGGLERDASVLPRDD